MLVFRHTSLVLRTCKDQNIRNHFKTGIIATWLHLNTNITLYWQTNCRDTKWKLCVILVFKLCVSFNIWCRHATTLIFLFHLVISARLAAHSIMEGLCFNIMFICIIYLYIIFCASLLYFKYNYNVSLRRCSCYDKILSLSTKTTKHVRHPLISVLLFD